MFHQINPKRLFCLTNAAILAVCLSSPMNLLPRLEAQEGNRYQPLSIPAELAADQQEHKNLKLRKNRIISAGGTGNMQELSRWYEQYFFRSFTLPDEYDNLPTKRRELLADLRKAGSGPIHDYLINQTLKFTKVFVQAKVGKREFPVHPAVRFNSMLIIGELNKVEASATARIPQPLPEALAFMVTEYRDPDQIDAVRVAALLGILRHAKLSWEPRNSWDPRVKNAIASMMLDLLNQVEPPQGRSLDGQIWMRRRAIDILAASGAIGGNKKANDAIREVVADPDQDLLVRCTAAGALGYYTPGSEQLDLADISMKLGALAADASRSELDWINEMKRRKAAKESTALAGSFATTSSGEVVDTNDAAQMMGVDVVTDEEDDKTTGFDGLMEGTGAVGPGGEADPEVQLARRRILSKLVCIKKGLEGIESAVTPEAKPQVDLVLDRFNQLMDATLPPESEPNLDGLAKNVRRAVRELEQLTKRATPRAPARPVGAARADLPPDTPTGGG